MSVLLLVLGLLAYCLGDPRIFDIAEPKDADLRPSYTGNATANPLAELLTWLRNRDFTEEQSYLRGTNTYGSALEWRAEDAEKVLAHYSEELDRWDALMATDRTTWRVPHVGDEGWMFDRLVSAVILDGWRIRVALEHSKFDDARRWSRELTQFGWGVTRAQGGQDIQALAMNGQMTGMLQELHTLHRSNASPAELLTVLRQWSEEEPRREDVQFSQQVAYTADLQMMSEVLRDRSAMHSWSMCMGEPDWWPSSFDRVFIWEFKPHRTQGEFLDYRRRLHAALGKNWSAVGAIVEHERDEFSTEAFYRGLRQANFGGHYFYVSWRVHSDVTAEGFFRRVALHRIARLELAMRIFELNHGKLPPSLAEVYAEVPEAAALRDPYTDEREPLRWSSGNGQLYALGPDGRDDGGRTNGMRNIGLRYEWRPDDPPPKLAPRQPKGR